MSYEDHYCCQCIHQPNCAVWSAHLLKNYDECNNKDSILHILIPRNEKGENEKCTMYIERRVEDELAMD